MIKTFEIACTGYSIMADWYQGKSTDKVLLILQGFMSARSRQADFTNYVVEATGASALVIDYSGHGDSPFELKDTRPGQHVLEVICAFDWIKAKYPNADITLIGNSYGSFLAAHLTMYREFEHLVLRAPAIYQPSALYDVHSKRFDDEGMYRQSITAYRHDTNELRKSPFFTQTSLRKPSHVLVVVHEHDEIIPSDTSDTFIEGFNAKSFIALGFSHAVSQSDVSGEQVFAYQKYIADWLMGVSL